MNKISFPVIIFDGVCTLCNSSVDFVIRNDKKRQFRYTANQMEVGREILRDQGLDPDNIHSIYLYQDGKLYSKSTAALRVARLLGFPFSLTWGGMVIPAFIRDVVYDWIASNRYKWFGKKETCRLPSAEERALFL